MVTWTPLLRLVMLVVWMVVPPAATAVTTVPRGFTPSMMAVPAGIGLIAPGAGRSNEPGVPMAVIVYCAPSMIATSPATKPVAFATSTSVAAAGASTATELLAAAPPAVGEPSSRSAAPTTERARTRSPLPAVMPLTLVGDSSPPQLPRALARTVNLTLAAGTGRGTGPIAGMTGAGGGDGKMWTKSRPASSSGTMAGATVTTPAGV